MIASSAQPIPTHEVTRHESITTLITRLKTLSMQISGDA